MSFSSLNPQELARADAALRRAWMNVVAKGLTRDSDLADRDRLIRIVVGLAAEAANEDDLVSLSVQAYLSAVSF